MMSLTADQMLVLASKPTAVGILFFAYKPNFFPDLMAAEIRKSDLADRPAQSGIAAVAPDTGPRS